ncbi:hypothetical protein [Kribbella sp. NBC_00359]|uniref:hypothetical protein n=1 Tax=Kribbella sp. NBC_00359 TaxID=2975966 RepID=UPI002E1FCEAB
MVPELVAGTAAKVRITSSSNGLEYLRDLREALPAVRDWDINVVQKRTAEIKLGADAGTQLYFMSVLESTESITIERGIVHTYSQGIHLLPLLVEPIRLLAPSRYWEGRPRTILQHIQDRVVFVMPAGGVVWDYVNVHYQDWAVFRPGQHVQVSEREAGLKMLNYGLKPGAAMLVHGFDKVAQLNIPGPGLDGYGLFDLVSRVVS